MSEIRSVQDYNDFLKENRELMLKNAVRIEDLPKNDDWILDDEWDVIYEQEAIKHVSLGSTTWEMDVSHQACDYLIELDENGDVENYTVTGPSGGMELSKDENVFVYGYDDDEKEIANTVSTTVVKATVESAVEENEPDYICAMGILGTYTYRAKIGNI